MKHLAIIIGAVVLAPVAFADLIVSESEADDARVTVYIDRQSAQVVEPIRLTVTVTAPRGSTVTFPVFQQELGPFQVRDVETIADLPTTPPAQAREWIMRIDLETLRTGLQTIPSLPVQYRPPTEATDAEIPNETRTFQTEPIDIQVVSLLEDRAELTDFRDIKPVVEFDLSEERSQPWVWWSVAASGLAALLIAGALLTLKKRRGVTPVDSAFAQIAQLESQIDQFDAETLYDQLALVVDRFLVLQFTTPDIFNDDEQHFVPAEKTYPAAVGESLAKFKSMSDDVRFARLTPDADQIQGVVDQAKAVIRAGIEPNASSSSEAA